MEEEIVCVDLQTLFKHYEKTKGLSNDMYSDFVWLDSGSFIIRKNDDDYHDLYSSISGSLKLCCDGEQCKVLERTADYVKLIDVENIDNEELEDIDTTFKLSTAEFNIATRG